LGRACKLLRSRARLGSRTPGPSKTPVAHAQRDDRRRPGARSKSAQDCPLTTCTAYGLSGVVTCGPGGIDMSSGCSNGKSKEEAREGDQHSHIVDTLSSCRSRSRRRPAGAAAPPRTTARAAYAGISDADSTRGSRARARPSRVDHSRACLAQLHICKRSCLILL
jgi:hypothetical protein